MENKTQLDIIKEILRRDGQIDNFHCFENKITLRLGARMWDLQQDGWRFETKKVGKNYIYKVLIDPEKELKLF